MGGGGLGKDGTEREWESTADIHETTRVGEKSAASFCATHARNSVRSVRARVPFPNDACAQAPQTPRRVRSVAIARARTTCICTRPRAHAGGASPPG
eukprot:3513888-Pleurochrysis_carterae.AAC.1